MDVLSVDLKDRGYNIYIDKGLLRNIDDILLECGIDDNIFIISDRNVAKHYLDILLSKLNTKVTGYCILEPGEQSKSIDTAKKVYEKMLEAGCNRKTTLISLGGGVVGDLTGFVAATFMRGINFVQVPTTLLSQVDSSIGGKVGVNFKNYKNIIGSFYQPKGVIIDTETLKTLDEREIINGLGEVFKYGLIMDYDFFLWLNDNLNSILKLENNYIMNIVKKSLNIKKIIVQKDEKESNIRKVLNFGHTIGHGIETLDDFNTFKHGEAVVLGMMLESLISTEMGLIDRKYYIKIIDSLSRLVSPVKFSAFEQKQIMNAIKHDKKNEKGKIVLVLPIGKGRVNIYNNVDEKLIEKSLKDGVVI
ncbi:3-dehydroquinate synthase [Caloranaerobacter azorensis DSM 13643]|uniref:3-dehydroquinate synthase n=1 Tax=Caloranaerobacter azorensis DSM 13643 TaxID=1121264 RepID=A0A1M5WKT7_9FIRM|nr:3-dehydroquinate synthase [Caloranaerobacter azorensis]SHH88058.1 3-dehydroquinate synthase [Caloranaerobacter azorensis DSM 13643]